MKIIFKLPLFAGLSFVLFACETDKELDCIPRNLRNDVLAFYPFSNGSTNDFSGNENHISNTSTAKVSTDRNGNVSCAFEFKNDSVNEEYLTTTKTSFLNNLDEFSLSLWYLAFDAKNDYRESLISRGNTPKCPDRLGEWSIILADWRTPVFGMSNSVWVQYLPRELTIDRWYHIVATCDKDGNVIKIYKDAILEEEGTLEADCGFGDNDVKDLGDLFLGLNLRGKLDDVIIFDKELDKDDVEKLYKMESCCD